ncbi:probable threonine aldolase [Cephalotrichum gorgonifer]|uniref:Probable threonine aldolase n=1 Tax=Cephalotrichum gorgonifer TaxID=2041049 RepID=A0AAE8MP29_9PEZI|nr:probable threonine aldolase [Cephalotrichum gorgonifer]
MRPISPPLPLGPSYDRPILTLIRGDTATTPTPSMLEAIQSCTLLDDVLQENLATNDLEAHVAALSGKEDGLFVLSGTMGNQLALRSLLVQPPHAVLCDSRSHVMCYEAGGVATLSGALVQAVTPSNGIHLTLEDVKKHAVLTDDVHDCPTKVISLENTLNGMIMPLSELQRISAFAREHGIKVHCDGARLWEAVAAGAGSLSDFCKNFDTASLCFSKGLGAPIGSILVGDRDVLKRARWVRKSIGGGLRQGGVVTAAARVAVDETFGRGPNGEGGLLGLSHETARKVEGIWAGMGGKLVHPVQTNMCWLDLGATGCSDERFVELGRAEGLKLMGGRLVISYQVALNEGDVLPKLERVFRAALAERDGREEKGEGRTSMYQ